MSAGGRGGAGRGRMGCTCGRRSAARQRGSVAGCSTQVSAWQNRLWVIPTLLTVVHQVEGDDDAHHALRPKGGRGSELGVVADMRTSSEGGLPGRATTLPFPGPCCNLQLGVRGEDLVDLPGHCGTGRRVWLGCAAGGKPGAQLQQGGCRAGRGTGTPPWRSPPPPLFPRGAPQRTRVMIEMRKKRLTEDLHWCTKPVRWAAAWQGMPGRQAATTHTQSSLAASPAQHPPVVRLPQGLLPQRVELAVGHRHKEGHAWGGGRGRGAALSRAAAPWHALCCIAPAPMWRQRCGTAAQALPSAILGRHPPMASSEVNTEMHTAARCGMEKHWTWGNFCRRAGAAAAAAAAAAGVCVGHAARAIRKAHAPEASMALHTCRITA